MFNNRRNYNSVDSFFFCETGGLKILYIYTIKQHHDAIIIRFWFTAFFSLIGVFFLFVLTDIRLIHVALTGKNLTECFLDVFLKSNLHLHSENGINFISVRRTVLKILWLFGSYSTDLFVLYFIYSGLKVQVYPS